MSCYYPLLGLPHDIDASLTVSSHTLNQRADPRAPSPLPHALDLALYGPDGDGWVLRDRLPIPLRGDRMVRASTYGLAPGEVLVAVPLSPDTPPAART
ncbi:MAG: hypothetical protein ACK41W_09610, partial [Cyanobacteriota bacterium]